MEIMNEKIKLCLWSLTYMLMVSIVPSIGIIKNDVSVTSADFLWMLLGVGILFQLLFLLAFYFLLGRYIINLKQIIFYSLFIILIIFVIIPLLSSISLDNITAFNKALAREEIPILVIRPTYFWHYLVINLSVSAIFGATLIGLMQKFRLWIKVLFIIILAYIMMDIAAKALILFSYYI